MLNGGYILCIDDDEDDCQLLADSFTHLHSNLRIEFKNSGEKALEFLHSAIATNDLARLIILDLNMPGLNGTQTLLLIRSIPALMKIPVLIFSTNVNDQDVIDIEKKGVSVLQKPNTVKGYEDLARTIAHMML
jgi:CheY-like chemotaxis protein